MRILVIEDERTLAGFIAQGLRAEGHAVTVRHDGDSGEAAALTGDYALVLLDLMLPGKDGLAVLKAIRARLPDLPVIVLTARAAVEQRVEGLDRGANDYVIKPFVVREVVLRVTALANRLAERRARPTASTGLGGTMLKVGPIELDPVTHDVRISGAPINLRPLEYKLLQLLVSDPGRVFSREELLEQVWEMRGDINTRTVDVHVRRLRVSLGPAADVIETVHGFGYRAKRE